MLSRGELFTAQSPSTKNRCPTGWHSHWRAGGTVPLCESNTCRALLRKKRCAKKGGVELAVEVGAWTKPTPTRTGGTFPGGRREAESSHQTYRQEVAATVEAGLHTQRGRHIDLSEHRHRDGVSRTLRQVQGTQGHVDGRQVACHMLPCGKGRELMLRKK